MGGHDHVPKWAGRCGLRVWLLLLLALALAISVVAGCGETEDLYSGTWVNEERGLVLEITKTDSGWAVYTFKGVSEAEAAKEDDGKLIWGRRDSQVFEVSGDRLKWTMKEPIGAVVYLERGE